MERGKKYFIRLVIVLKVLLGIGLLIGISSRLSDQYTYLSSGVPEHEHFAKANGSVIWNAALFFIPLVFSLIVDFNEQRKKVLKWRWFIVMLAFVLGIVMINEMKGSILANLISALLTFGFFYIIQLEKRTGVVG